MPFFRYDLTTQEKLCLCQKDHFRPKKEKENLDSRSKMLCKYHRVGQVGRDLSGSSGASSQSRGFCAADLEYPHEGAPRPPWLICSCALHFCLCCRGDLVLQGQRDTLFRGKTEQKLPFGSQVQRMLQSGKENKMPISSISHPNCANKWSNSILHE